MRNLQTDWGAKGFLEIVNRKVRAVTARVLNCLIQRMGIVNVLSQVCVLIAPTGLRTFAYI